MKAYLADNSEIALVEVYWNMLRSLSDEIKLRLATRLTAAVIKNHELEDVQKSSQLTTRMLDKYCGAWQGSETADDVVKCIRENSSIRKVLDV